MPAPKVGRNFPGIDDAAADAGDAELGNAEQTYTFVGAGDGAGIGDAAGEGRCIFDLNGGTRRDRGTGAIDDVAGENRSALDVNRTRYFTGVGDVAGKARHIAEVNSLAPRRDRAGIGDAAEEGRDIVYIEGSGAAADLAGRGIDDATGEEASAPITAMPLRSAETVPLLAMPPRKVAVLLI